MVVCGCVSLRTEVVFEDCQQKGGVRQTLLPYAIIALAVYTIAFPCTLFYILYENRMKIMEDQLLRAEDRGGSRLENPNCYNVRKMYHKSVQPFLTARTFPLLISVCHDSRFLCCTLRAWGIQTCVL